MIHNTFVQKGLQKVTVLNSFELISFIILKFFSITLSVRADMDLREERRGYIPSKFEKK